MEKFSAESRSPNTDKIPDRLPASDKVQQPSAQRDETSTLSKLQNDALRELSGWGNLIKPVGQRIERLCNETTAQKPKEPTAVDWLVAIDITTKDFGHGDNLEMRKAHLASLAAETKGKPVAIVAQFAIADVDKKQMDKYSWVVPHPYHVDRYLIRDGKMDKLDTVNSGGYAADVKNLLSFATGQFKGAKLALMIDSHGAGNRGLTGDTGSTTIPDFVDAVKKGMQGRDKLDLIDFDACFMGQNGVIGRLRPLTNNVVASAETEGGLGQDLVTPIRSLLKDSKMDGAQLANVMIETARLTKAPVDVVSPKPPEPRNVYQWLQQSLTPKDTETVKRVPVKTLAHYELTHYEQFQSELDQFGTGLCAVMKDPKNLRTINRLLDSVPAYGGRDKIDLKSFVEGIVDAATTGKLDDPGNTLRIHGGRVLDAHKKIVPSYSGFYEYSSRGGLSFYAPESSELQFQKRALDRTWAADFTRSCQNPPDLSSKKDEYVKQLDARLKGAATEISKSDETDENVLNDVKLKWHAADGAVKQLKTASSIKETFDALTAMRNAAMELETSDFFKNKIAQNEKKIRKELEEYYKKELITPDGGWGKFREALRQ